MACPRLLAEDGTPCNFISSYMPLPLDSENGNAHHKEVFTYVVLKKGPRNASDTWPRIVRPTRRLFDQRTQYGKLEEVIFTRPNTGKLP